MKESFEQAEKKTGEKFQADEHIKYNSMVDRAVEAGTVPSILAEILKSPGVEVAVRTSVTAERELKTGPVTKWKENGLYLVFAKNACAGRSEDVSACVDGMLVLAKIGLKDPTFGFVPSADDTSDVAIHTRRHPGTYPSKPLSP